MTKIDKSELTSRLAVLREEQSNGQLMRASLEGRLSELGDTLLRIEGAIQVLDELLAPEDSASKQGGPKQS